MENNTPIPLNQIWRIDNLGEYKVHFARWNGYKQPLQAWAEDRINWVEWQQYWPGRNDFNRKFIFSLMDYYHETDTWLFGGVFHVIGIVEQNDCKSYSVELTDQGAPFIGRLKLSSSYRKRSTRVKFENHYSEFMVKEILQEAYTGLAFCGYDNIRHGFSDLEHIWSIQKPDWKAALVNLQGVYLITDTSNGRNYVGSAYGDSRIWGRWNSYLLGDGHGGNAGLRKLLRENGGRSYAKYNFQFSLLEYWAREVDDSVIVTREGYWKDVLQSRQYGYNEN